MLDRKKDTSETHHHSSEALIKQLLAVSSAASEPLIPVEMTRNDLKNDAKKAAVEVITALNELGVTDTAIPKVSASVELGQHESSALAYLERNARKLQLGDYKHYDEWVDTAELQEYRRILKPKNADETNDAHGRRQSLGSIISSLAIDTAEGKAMCESVVDEDFLAQLLRLNYLQHLHPFAHILGLIRNKFNLEEQHVRILLLLCKKEAPTLKDSKSNTFLIEIFRDALNKLRKFDMLCTENIAALFNDTALAATICRAPYTKLAFAKLKLKYTLKHETELNAVNALLAEHKIDLTQDQKDTITFMMTENNVPNLFPITPFITAFKNTLQALKELKSLTKEKVEKILDRYKKSNHILSAEQLEEAADAKDELLIAEKTCLLSTKQTCVLSYVKNEKRYRLKIFPATTDKKEDVLALEISEASFNELSTETISAQTLLNLDEFSSDKIDLIAISDNLIEKQRWEIYCLLTKSSGFDLTPETIRNFTATAWVRKGGDPANLQSPTSSKPPSAAHSSPPKNKDGCCVM